MSDVFPITHVAAWPLVGDEMMGTKPKFWLQSPSGTNWLFKQKQRLNSGDDWSEKVASELAALLTLPHATVELATRGSERGIVSRDLVAECGAEELIPGNSLLVEADPRYPTDGYYRVASHTLDRILAVFSSLAVGLPSTVPSDPSIAGAADLFTGYLLFDTWIANSDRHHENWAVLKTTGSRFVLCPSYDHAASLGHNVPDATRQEKLDRKAGSGVEEYVRSPKIRSAIFLCETDSKALSPLDAFRAAAGKAPAAARYWLDQLSKIAEHKITDIVNRVPDVLMSKLAKAFAQQMLCENRARLLASCY